MGGAYSTHGRYEKCIKMLFGKPERKRSHGRPRRRWEDNITMDPRQVEWEVVDWIQGPVAGSYERDNEHYSSIKGREFLD